MNARGGIASFVSRVFRARADVQDFRKSSRMREGGKMKERVLVTGSSVEDRFLAPLRNAGLEVENPTDLLNEQQLSDRLKEASAYLLGGDEIATRKALQSAKKLKVLAFLGVGYESFIDVAAAIDLGIAVTNTPGTLTQSVAEFTIGQAINATRRLSVYGNRVRDEMGGKKVEPEQKRHDLSSLRVGIIGLGTIGTRIAEILTTGFGCSIRYYSRTRKPDVELQLSIKYADLDLLLKETDVLFLMLPGNENTKSFLGQRELGLLPSGAIVVNTARPELIEPQALLNALQEGVVGTAVLDGFYENGIPARQALLDLPQEKLLVTRHIASLTHEARDGMAKMAVESILNFLQTGDDPHVVNKRR